MLLFCYLILQLSTYITDNRIYSYNIYLKGKKENIENYDVIFIGYPIWWNVAPSIIHTFMESYSLEGKTVLPFATSGSSSIDNSVAELKKAYPQVKWRSGKRLNYADKTTIAEWLQNEGILINTLSK